MCPGPRPPSPSLAGWVMIGGLRSGCGGTVGWDTALACRGARASGFTTELLSLGLPLHLWLLSLRLGAVLAGRPGHGPDTGVWAVDVWFPSSWLARQTFFFVLMHFFKCRLRDRFVSGQLLRGETGGPGRAGVRAVGGAAMGLGPWESGLVPMVPGVPGALPQGSWQRDQQVPGSPCPGLLGTEEGVGRDTGWCRGVALPRASCCLPRGTPCSQRVPGEEAPLCSPGRGSQPHGISQGQLRAVTGISVSLR